MDVENPRFTAQESLVLIRSMIETTKTSISDNSAFFLIWGYATVVGCLLQYILLVFVQYPHHYIAWLVTPFALLLHILFAIKSKKAERVKTFIGEANGFVWIIVGCSYLALAIIFYKIGWQYSFPFYILLYGIGTYISGSLLKFKPMRFGGAFCLCIAAFTPYTSYSNQILLAAFAILISYIVPGHLLRSQYRKNNNR
ncbi:MAG TPA: hypothetical protein VF610_10380 [Segetibacter sp.]|jgi:hypothetical protein